MAIVNSRTININDEVYDVGDFDIYLFGRKDYSVVLRNCDKKILYSLFVTLNCHDGTRFNMIWSDLLCLKRI